MHTEPCAPRKLSARLLARYRDALACTSSIDCPEKEVLLTKKAPATHGTTNASAKRNRTTAGTLPKKERDGGGRCSQGERASDNLLTISTSSVRTRSELGGNRTERRLRPGATCFKAGTARNASGEERRTRWRDSGGGSCVWRKPKFTILQYCQIFVRTFAPLPRVAAQVLEPTSNKRFRNSFGLSSLGGYEHRGPRQRAPEVGTGLGSKAGSSLHTRLR